MFSSKMQTSSFWYSKRFIVSILTFFGQLITYVSLSNVNMVILEMTSTRSITLDNHTIISGPEFNWDTRTIGVILGATSYGSICGIIIAGYLAQRFGGSTMIIVGSLISSITILLTPTVVHYNFYLFLILRAVDGFGIEIKFASTSELWSKWSPIEDRSKLMAIGFSGIYAGILIAYPICGIVIHRFGWPVTFYAIGGIYLLWTLLWFIIVSNDPACDKCISQEELTYIKKNQEEAKPMKIRRVIQLHKNMITSKVILAFCLMKFAFNSGFTIILTCLPMFVKDITNTEIDKIGIIASIPNIVATLTIAIMGYIIDTLKNKGLMTITQIHKLFVGIGLIGGSVLLFITSYYSSTLTISIILLTIFKLLLTFCSIITLTLSIYIAPSCAVIVVCFTDIFYFLSAIISPMIIGFMVTNHTALEWSTCFCVFGLILLIGGVIFLIYGSSEPQPWSNQVDENSHCQPSIENKIL